MTKRLILLVSELTGKIIRFGSGIRYHKDITKKLLSVNNIASDTTNYHPNESNTDFTPYWAHKDNLDFDLDSDRIQDPHTL